MYYVKLFNISIYPYSCSWGCFPICLVLVASSLSVGGSGMLQSNLWQDIEKYIRSCTTYAITKPSIKKQGLYNLLPTPSGPWESISMDCMSGLPSTKHGNDCVFVHVDRFSKMAIMAACKKNITAKSTSKLFFEWMWVHFGIPQSIISDWDSRFLSTLWSSLWSMLDTKLTKSTTFHPRTNGKTEVINRMIVHILHMYN